MGQPVIVCIGIQARSTSSRLPRKIHEVIDDETVLQHLIDSCRECQHGINRYSYKTNQTVKIALLVPHGDECIREYKSKVDYLVEGSEENVLERYLKAMDLTSAQYMVRVTADCPMIPPRLITKHINAAIMQDLDYLSNVDPRVRTALDGHDCEVISRSLMHWLSENATEKEDLEHVTTLIRKAPPLWIRMNFTLNQVDLSGLKLSIDTIEDLNRVKKMYDKVKEKADMAEKLKTVKAGVVWF